MTEDRELSDEASNHCERVREKKFRSVQSALSCNVFTFALIGVIRGPILASIFDAGPSVDGAPGGPRPTNAEYA
jgi:hypothetical protein